MKTSTVKAYLVPQDLGQFRLCEPAKALLLLLPAAAACLLLLLLLLLWRRLLLLLLLVPILGLVIPHLQ